MTISPAPGSSAYEYQLQHWDDDLRPQSIAGCAIVVSAATVMLVLRLASQRIYFRTWNASDWLVLAAWVIAVPIAAEAIVSYTYGLGLHQVRVILSDSDPPNGLVLVFENGYFVTMAWVPCLACVKLSLLLYFRALFQGSQRWFKVSVWVLAIYTIAWAIASTPVLIWQCNPIPLFWEREVVFYGVDPVGLTGSCLPQLAHLAPPSIASTIADGLIWALPVTVLAKLQLSTQRRAGLLLLFSIGLFTVGTGIVRIVYIFKIRLEEDVTYDNSGAVIWTVVETSVAVVCACIPPSMPLIRSILRSVGLHRSVSKHEPLQTLYQQQMGSGRNEFPHVGSEEQHPHDRGRSNSGGSDAEKVELC